MIEWNIETTSSFADQFNANNDNHRAAITVYVQWLL